MTASGEALFVTVEPLGERLAGPAIRALELARAVARSGAVARVRLVSLDRCDRVDADVELSVAGADLVGIARGSAAVVVQGDVLNRVPQLGALDVPIVVDAYDPFHLEQLEQTRDVPEAQRLRIVRDCIRALNDQLTRADLVLCASERQRSLWLGHLAAVGRVNPLTYDQAPDLGALVAVVPFGTSSAGSRRGDRGAVLAAAVPGITPDDVLVIWGGGIYPWFDAEVLIDAMAGLATSHPRLKLLFLGTRHPLQPDVETPQVAALRKRAAATGSLGRTVFFHTGWVPYDERHDWLGTADAGISTHHRHLETEFSYRTRVVDYLAAGLPVVTTEGDALADLVRATGCGTVVPPDDPAPLAAALVALADDAVTRRAQADRAAAAAAELAWDRVARPLVEFCRSPRRAPDLAAPADVRALLEVSRGGAVQRVRATLAEGGAALLAERLRRRLGSGRGDR